MKIVDLTKAYFHSLAQELTAKVPDMPSLAKNLKVQRMAILIVAAMLLSVLLTPAINFSPPHFKVGSIAPKDVKADRDFLVEDRTSTEQKKRESVERTRSVYDYDVTYAAKFIPAIPTSFSKMRIACANLENARLADIQALSGNKTFNAAKMDFENTLGIKLSEQELKILLREKFSEDIADRIVLLLQAVYTDSYVVNSTLLANDLSLGIIIRNVKTQVEREQGNLSPLLSLENAQHLLLREAGTILQDTKRDVRPTVLSLAKRLVLPDLTFNRNATEKKKQDILAQIKPVFFSCAEK